MYHGIFEGAAAAAQPKKILILGESHHGDVPEDVRKPGKGSTKEVVMDYLSQKAGTEQCLQFFHKIALSFGVDVGKDEEKKLFWDKVFFGNYVDVLCGVQDGTAERLMKQNKETYNQELAEFVNRHQIDTVFCFGLGVFDCLPGDHYAGILPGEVGDTVSGKRFEENQSIELAGYLCEPPSGPFDHPVRIYGMTHPSRPGFSPKPFVEYLKPVFEDCCG